jgi:hypothetical protein
VSTIELVDDFDLVSVTECFAEAESRGKEVYDQPEQAKLREQLPRLLKAIFASSEFHAKLTPKERIVFYNDYTRGITALLLKGDCQPLFEDMQEWYEYLEELIDYDEFEADVKEEYNLVLRDIELA